MLHRSSSAAGVRFLASIKEGRGLKPSAREAGIDKEVGYRWLRERYLDLRRDGKTPAESTAFYVRLGVPVAVRLAGLALALLLKPI